MTDYDINDDDLPTFSPRDVMRRLARLEHDAQHHQHNLFPGDINTSKAFTLAAPADRVVQEPNPEDMAETICQWQNVLGSEGLAKKLIALYWRGAKAGEGTR